MIQENTKLQGSRQLTLWGSSGPGRFTFILVSGKAGVGKTTVTKFMEDYLERYGFHTFLTPLAEEVKKCARVFFGWDGKKDERGRRLLQNIGTEIGRQYDENIWVKHLLNKTNKHIIYPDFILVDDWRFPNEASYIEDLNQFNVVKIHIDAPEREVLRGTPEENHPSEISLPSDEDGNGYYDFVIVNDKSTSLENLKGMAEKIVDILLERSKV